MSVEMSPSITFLTHFAVSGDIPRLNGIGKLERIGCF